MTTTSAKVTESEAGQERQESTEGSARFRPVALAGLTSAAICSSAAN